LGEVVQPDFDVNVEKTVYQIGEPIEFKFTGSPDNIQFYSGTNTNNYDFKDNHRIIDVSDAGATLSFTSQILGTSINVQNNQVSVWVSHDYNGKDTFEDIQNATWTDITDNFILATNNTTAVSSGIMDFSDYIGTERNTYIAFKYVTKPQADNGVARQWSITNFSLKSDKTLGSRDIFITNQEYSGFRIINQYPLEAPSLSNVTSTILTLYGNRFLSPTDDGYNPNNPWNDVQTETWAVSKPLKKGSVDLGKDWAVSIKRINTDFMESYIYTYDEPGVYTATFVASNSNINETKSTVRKVTLTIQ